MNAVEVVEQVLATVPDPLVVSSLGNATSALRAVSDDGPHLYLGGSMGAALAVALGVAARRPQRQVLCLLGDGEALMGAGSLWALAGSRPGNLLAVVLADGRYTITGGQPLGTLGRLAEVAAALGLASATAASGAELEQALASLPRPALLEARIDEQPPGALPSPFVDPPVVRWRFEQAASKEPEPAS